MLWNCLEQCTRLQASAISERSDRSWSAHTCCALHAFVQDHCYDVAAMSMNHSENNHYKSVVQRSTEEGRHFQRLGRDYEEDDHVH